MTRASRLWSRIVGGVEQNQKSSEHGRPSGSRAVIDAQAAARLSAVIRDGEFDEQVPEGASGHAEWGFASAPSAIPRAVPATAVATLAIACLWASGRDFAEISRRSTHAATAGGSFGTSRAAVGPMFGAGGDPGARDGDQAMSAKNRMRAAVVAAAAATGSALAQDAVQWRVEDGGNGHWYQTTIPMARISADEASTASVEVGGFLASIGSAAENEFVFSLARATPSLWTVVWPGATQISGPWIGATYSDGTWEWSDSTPWGFTNWSPGNPNYLPGESAVLYMGLVGGPPTNQWNNLYPDYLNWGYIIEWSADCNNDGIVDYGQILQGQLADTNANGVPDTCESPTCADADLFPTGTVNGADLGAMLSQWGEAPAGTASDLNHDGAVDGTDLGILLSFWGPCEG